MAVKVELARTIIGGPPKLRFPDSVWKEVGGEIVDDIRWRVLRQETIDGGRIKENESSTLDRKKAQGKPLLSLIDKLRRFVKKGFWIIKAGGNKVEIEHEYPKVLRAVQEMGYVDWFGIGPRGVEKVREVFIKAIRAAQAKAAQQRRTERS